MRRKAVNIDDRPSQIATETAEAFRHLQKAILIDGEFCAAWRAVGLARLWSLIFVNLKAIDLGEVRHRSSLGATWPAPAAAVYPPPAFIAGLPSHENIISAGDLDAIGVEQQGVVAVAFEDHAEIAGSGKGELLPHEPITAVGFGVQQRCLGLGSGR